MSMNRARKIIEAIVLQRPEAGEVVQASHDMMMKHPAIKVFQGVTDAVKSYIHKNPGVTTHYPDQGGTPELHMQYPHEHVLSLLKDIPRHLAYQHLNK